MLACREDHRELNMIGEISKDVFRRHINRRLLAVLTKPDAVEDVALQIIEIIAWRMPKRADAEVACVGAFVRANLYRLDQGLIGYCELLERFTHAALSAAGGYSALEPVFRRSLDGLSRP